MTDRKLLVFVLFMAAALGGHFWLRSYSQGWFRTYLLVPVLWAVLYFPLYNRLGRLLADDWDPALPRPMDVSLVNVVCILAGFCIVHAVILLSLGAPQTTQSPLQEKRYHARSLGGSQSWRLVLEDGSYFYVPYERGRALRAGDPIRLTHRDAWLGVRIVQSYQLPNAPESLYDQWRDAPLNSFY